MDKDIVKNIKESGWYAITVLESSFFHTYTYTIGIWETYKKPELIISGLDGKTSHSIFHSIINGNLDIKFDTYNNQILNEYQCYLGRVDHEQYDQIMGKLLWYYKESYVPVCQIIWPDKNGFYVWENEFQGKQELFIR